jgi:hypothetical protein
MENPKQNGLSGNWGIAIGFLVLIGAIGAASWLFAPRFYNPPPQPSTVELVDSEGNKVERTVDGEAIDQQLAQQGIDEPTDADREAIAQEIADARQAAEEEIARAREEAEKNKTGLLGRIFGGGN